MSMARRSIDSGQVTRATFPPTVKGSSLMSPGPPRPKRCRSSSQCVHKQAVWTAIQVKNPRFPLLNPQLIIISQQRTPSSDIAPPTDSNGWVSSITYHIVDLNIFIGSSHLYTCYFDFRDLHGNTFHTPSASFYIVDSTPTDVFKIHSANNQTFTLASPAASSSAASSSSAPPSPITTTAFISGCAQNVISPGTVAGLSLIAGLIAFFCIRGARHRRRRNQSEQHMPFWQEQKYQQNGLGVNGMRAATVPEKAGVGHVAEVSGDGIRSVGELEAGPGR